jgi:hypothetical protein
LWVGTLGLQPGLGYSFEMICSVATTTWDSLDILPAFLRHYRKLGVRRVLVMDLGSNDGTADLLGSGEWRDFVEPVAFPGLALLDSSNVMLSTARRTANPGEWCLFCDPDEFLVVSPMAADSLARASLGPPLEQMLIPRFNMTGPRSVTQHSRLEDDAVSLLTLRVDRRHRRNGQQEIASDVLAPSWIFTEIPGKVLVRLDTALSVGDGDHSASTATSVPAGTLDGARLLHYPFRSYPGFHSKIERARLDYAANPQLPPSFGWQVRRWIRLHDAGRLHDEYLQQFIPDETVNALLDANTLCRDETVRNFHRRSGE